MDKQHQRIGQGGTDGADAQRVGVTEPFGEGGTGEPSAGQRGIQIVLSPADYIRASEATVADLTKSAQPLRSAEYGG